MVGLQVGYLAAVDAAERVERESAEADQEIDARVYGLGAGGTGGGRMKTVLLGANNLDKFVLTLFQVLQISFYRIPLFIRIFPYISPFIVFVARIEFTYNVLTGLFDLWRAEMFCRAFIFWWLQYWEFRFWGDFL